MRYIFYLLVLFLLYQFTSCEPTELQETLYTPNYELDNQIYKVPVANLDKDIWLASLVDSVTTLCCGVTRYDYIVHSSVTGNSFYVTVGNLPEKKGQTLHVREYYASNK